MSCVLSYTLGTLVLTIFSVSLSVPSVTETRRGIENLLSCTSFPAHIRRRAVRVLKLTPPTKRLTRKLRNCLRKRVGGMNPEATRMGMSCCFKYVSANTVAVLCPRLHLLPAPVSGSHVTHTPIWIPLCFIHQLRLTPCRPWYCTSTPLF
jgi:hypothetical protein